MPTSPGSPFGNRFGEQRVRVFDGEILFNVLLHFFVELFDEFDIEVFNRSGEKFARHGQRVNDKRTCSDDDHKNHGSNAPAHKLFGINAFIVGKTAQETDA